MSLFYFGVATEPNNFTQKGQKDQVWIKNDKGQLILMEVKDNDDNQE